MTQDFAVDFGPQARATKLMMTLPLPVAVQAEVMATIIIHAVLQIQKATFAFVSKIFTMSIVMPRLLERMISFIRHLIVNLSNHVR